MKRILYVSFAAFALAACSNSDNADENPVAGRDSIGVTEPDSTVVMLKVTEEDALRLVSQVKEIEAELKRTYPDTTVKNVLLLMQGASSDDPRHYVQLTEIHPENAVALMHFSVDAYTGEVKVMDPLSEGEIWITLDQWRKMKI
jgi:hypothetical protein